MAPGRSCLRVWASAVCSIPAAPTSVWIFIRNSFLPIHPIIQHLHLMMIIIMVIIKPTARLVKTEFSSIHSSIHSSELNSQFRIQFTTEVISGHWLNNVTIALQYYSIWLIKAERQQDSRLMMQTVIWTRLWLFCHQEQKTGRNQLLKTVIRSWPVLQLHPNPDWRRQTSALSLSLLLLQYSFC